MARCKEAKFKVAKRHYLQISPANFLLCHENLSAFNICKIYGGVIWSFFKRDEERQPCHVFRQEQAFDTLKLSAFFGNLL